MSDTKPIAIKESFARFFEQPSREGLRELLKNNLGEERDCDFKEAWPEFSGVAKHILGFANSGGGCMIFGVKEIEDGSFHPKGLKKLVDKADFSNGLQSYLPHPLFSSLVLQDFAYEASEYPKIIGKSFQVVIVPKDSEHLPFVSVREGSGIRRNAIYIRKQGLTEEANYEELQSILNQRLATRYSTAGEIKLKNHLEELKVLYSEIRESQTFMAFPDLSKQLRDVLPLKTVKNLHYPSEGYEQYIARLIRMKKRRIEVALDTIHPYAHESPPLGN